jgi:hypothetical protein
MRRGEAYRPYGVIAIFIAFTFMIVGGMAGDVNACHIDYVKVCKSFDNLEPDTRSFDLDRGTYWFTEYVRNTSDRSENLLTWIDYHMEIEGNARFLEGYASSSVFSDVDAGLKTLDFYQGGPDETVEPGEWVGFKFKVYVYSGCGEIKLTQYPTVPEPATMLLLGTGLIGLAGLGRRKIFKK